MDWHIDLLAAVGYALVFLLLIFRGGMFQWFWGSVILWLGVSYLGSLLLPGIWGFTHVGPLFIPHFYLTLASLFFFVDFWKKAPEEPFWQADSRHVLLSLFAVSNIVMTAAFLVILGVIAYRYPTGISVLAIPALLKFYALKPIYWFLLQLTMIGVFYVHRVVIMKQPGSWFSKHQLVGGYCLAFFCQIAVLIALVLEGRLL